MRAHLSQQLAEPTFGAHDQVAPARDEAPRPRELAAEGARDGEIVGWLQLRRLLNLRSTEGA